MRCRPRTASSSTVAATARVITTTSCAGSAGGAPRWSSPDLERWAESTASDLGYSDVTHTVEIFGVCAAAALSAVRLVQPAVENSPASMTVSPRWVSVRKR